MNTRQTLIIAAVVIICVLPACASVETLLESTPSKHDMNAKSMENMHQETMPGIDNSAMQGQEQSSTQSMDHDAMKEGQSQDSMSGMNHSTSPNMDHNSMKEGQQQSSTPGMDHSTMQGMDHSTMQGMDHSTMQGMDHNVMNEGQQQDAMSGMDLSVMRSMDMDGMQGGSAPADARDPHAYSDGYDFGPFPRPIMGDEHNFGSLRVDRLEVVQTSDNTTAAFDLQAWYGRDYNRAVFKAEGAYDNGDLEESSTELLWGHAVMAYWDTQLGLRYDSGAGTNRTWLAFGMQGLAPYWFEVDATGYVGEEGRTALNLEVEYEILFTQKLILQPRLEMDLYAKDDRARGIGSGLSEVAAGLRLRYEIWREFAPYIGVEWIGKFGNTAHYTREAGLDAKETQAISGVRFWF